MTGSIQTKKDRKNYYAVLNYFDEKGKRKQRWVDTDIPVKGNNKRKADAKLKEILARYGDASVDFSKDILFTDFYEDWLETHKHSIAPTTYDSYLMTFKVHILPFFKSKKLMVSRLTPKVFQQYVQEKLEKVSQNTVRKHLGNLSKCLDSAVKQNLIAINPVKRIETPKKTKYTGAKFYNETQMAQLLEISKTDPLNIVILLTLTYGLRRSEVLGIRWSAVDFEADTLEINHTVVKVDKTVHRLDSTKNESSHAKYPLARTVKAELLEWKAKQDYFKSLQPKDFVDSGYVCTYNDGRPLSPNFVSQHFALLLKKGGMPHIRFHDLRHSSATYLHSLGFSLKEIQTWLRHSDIRTTMNIYTHIDMDAKNEMANKLDVKLQKMSSN